MSEKKKRGRPSTGFDKKAYDRERMKRLRAEAKAIYTIPQPKQNIPHT